MTTNNKISPMQYCYNVIPFLYNLKDLDPSYELDLDFWNPKDLDPSYKMDLDFWDCFGRKITLSYSHKNTVS